MRRPFSVCFYQKKPFPKKYVMNDLHCACYQVSFLGYPITCKISHGGLAGNCVFVKICGLPIAKAELPTTECPTTEVENKAGSLLLFKATI